MDDVRDGTEESTPIISVPLVIDFFRDDTGIGKGYLFLDYDESESGRRPCYRWSNSKEKATLDEAIALVDKYKKLLPDNEESFNAYYSRYMVQDEERLIYSEFNHPWHRLSIETKFCCLARVMPTRVFANIDAFSKLLVKSTDRNFIDFMIGNLSCYVRIDDIEDKVIFCGLSPEVFHCSSVLKELYKYVKLWEQRYSILKEHR
jgi:hypothetical protein